MFGELPKLFGRDFAIGFLLPVAFLIPLSYLVADGFGDTSLHAALEEIRGLKDQPALLGATIFTFVLWFGGVTLLALNRTIIRVKEGYGKWNPARLWAALEKRRLKALKNRLSDLESEIPLMEKLSLTSEQDVLIASESDLSLRFAERFPDFEEYVLPTAFGNAIRAFEVYPRVMYGLDSIPSWPRLLMVMSGDVRGLVDSAKSEMDFWLNLWVVSLVLVAEHLALALLTQSPGNLWLLLFLVLLVPLSSNRAKEAAIGWGEMVKAAFDVHLAKLRKTFEMQERQDRETERQQWEGLSRALIYRSPKDLPLRSAAVAASEEEDGGGRE